MIWDNPAFADFLGVELDSIGPGFVAACLVMHAADQLTSSERSDLCRRIMFGKRLDLIPGVRETCSPRSAIAVFGGLRPDELSMRTCQALLGVLCDRGKARFVARGQPLTLATIRLLDRLPPWACTGNLPALLGDLDDAPSIETEFVELVERVEQEAEGLRTAVRRSLSQARNRDRLVAAIRSWNARIDETVGFPAPPFPAAGALCPLSSAEMLRSEARRMRNCIANYLPDILAGRVYFYRWDAAEPATIMLERRASGEWRLEEYLGLDNDDLTEPTRARIRAAVQAAIAPPRGVLNGQPRARRGRPRRRLADRRQLVLDL